MKAPTYHEDLIDRLRNPKYAIAYLNTCLEDYEEGTFLLALRHVTEAHGGIRKLAKKIGVSREHLFRMLSKAGNPRFDNLRKLVHSFGWKVMLVNEKGSALRRAA